MMMMMMMMMHSLHKQSGWSPPCA